MESAGSRPIHEAGFVAQLAWVSRAYNVWRNNLDVLPDQVVDDVLENEPHNNSTDETKRRRKTDRVQRRAIVDRLTTTYLV